MTAREQQSFFRAFPAELQMIGTHQLSGRLVPYNMATDVVDELTDGGHDVYREGFRPGAFGPQIHNRKQVLKVGLQHRHGPDGLGYLGPFTGLHETRDGLYGEVNILPSKAEDVFSLIEAGVDELSIEFRLPKADHTEVVDGVRWRTRAHLDQVALEPKGAYTAARVLQFRAEADEEADEKAKAEEERQAAAKAEADEKAERDRLEREAAEAAETKRKWDEMTGERLDRAAERQREYTTRFGMTKPGGIGSI